VHTPPLTRACRSRVAHHRRRCPGHSTVHGVASADRVGGAVNRVAEVSVSPPVLYEQCDHGYGQLYPCEQVSSALTVRGLSCIRTKHGTGRHPPNAHLAGCHAGRKCGVFTGVQSGGCMQPGVHPLHLRGIYGMKRYDRSGSLDQGRAGTSVPPGSRRR